MDIEDVAFKQTIPKTFYIRQIEIELCTKEEMFFFC